MKKTAMLVVSSAALILLASCALISGTQNNGSLSDSEIASFQKYFMSSYYSDDGGNPAGLGAKALTPFAVSSPSGAKATVTVGSDVGTATKFADYISAGSTTLSNYPEKGQTSVFAVSVAEAANSVYDIKVTTAFGSNDSRNNYVEEYYVQDKNPNSDTADGYWTIADPVVAKNGSTWTVNSAARVQMVLTYDSGVIVNEKIYKVYPSDGSTFIPAASVKYGRSIKSRSSDNATPPAAAARTSDNEMYSSVVVYIEDVGQEGFWNKVWHFLGAGQVLGVRYYTEYVDGSSQKYIGATESHEVALYSVSSYSLDDPDTLISAVFQGADTSESVSRKQTVWNLSTNSYGIYCAGDLYSSNRKMQSLVTDGRDNKVYTLKQEDSDYVTLVSIE